MRRLLVVLVVVAPLLAPAIAAVPAAPAAADTVTDAGVASSVGPRLRGVITFHKNYPHPLRSRLTWKLKKRVHGRWKVVDEAEWRAGSGRGGRRGTDACANNVGWLPDGRYHLRQYVDYHGRLIRGRAFRIDDKRCRTGNLRFNLFIHTEQGARNRQCPDRRGDQVCRWEYPRINDYRSAGCIKLRPRDLAALVRHYRKAFRPGVRYPLSRVVLVVR